MPRAMTREEYNTYMRGYILERYHRRRVEAIEFLGGCCKRCGVTDGLQFDHVDRTTKTGTIGKMWSYSAEKFWAEVRKCQLLCHPCHVNKGRECGDIRPWQHGTEYAWDKHRCRCSQCDAAHDVHLEKRRARRRRGRVR